MQWLIACLCYLGTSQIHILVPRSQHVLKKGVVWIWPFLLTQPLSISIRLDRRSTYVLCVLHVPTRFLSTLQWHPSRFYYTIGTLPSRPPRLYCTTLLVCPQYVHVIYTAFLLHYPHVLHSKTVKWIIPSVCICNFINISAKSEVCIA